MAGEAGEAESQHAVYYYNIKVGLAGHARTPSGCKSGDIKRTIIKKGQRVGAPVRLRVLIVARTKMEDSALDRALGRFRVIGHMVYISGSACSTVGVHSQAWSTSGIGRLGSKSGRG
jgi:hypothetical protein